MSIKYRYGDLFEIEKTFDEPIVIAHVCNNQGKWGSGFVIPLGRKYPLAKYEYLDWYHEHAETPDYQKKVTGLPYKTIVYEDVFFELGNLQVVEVYPDKRYVANMVAQELGGFRPLFYNHLCKCMDEVANLIKDEELPNKIIAPQFGAGLAGGNWHIIKELINDCWCRNGIDVTIVRYEQ